MTKQETLTAEQVAFIVEIAAKGMTDIQDVPRPIRILFEAVDVKGMSCGVPVQPTPSALTIAALASENAKLRAALEQACETAEQYHETSGDHLDDNLPCCLVAMRENRRGLLK